jgi:hypothetical protein
MIAADPPMTGTSLARYGSVLKGVEAKLPAADIGLYAAECVLVQRFSDELDALANAGGVRPLSEFLSMSADEAPNFLPDDFELPPTEWFDPKEALASVEVLLEKLPGKLPRSGEIVTELETLAEVLQLLQKKKRRFHFFIVE